MLEQNSLFDEFCMDGKTYKPLAICTKERASATAELYRSYGKLAWIPLSDWGIDGYLCCEV